MTPTPRKQSKQTDLCRRQTERKCMSSNMQRVLGRVVTRSRFVYSSYVILIGWFCIYRKTCSIFGELTCLAFLRRTEYGDLSSENSDMGT